MNVILVSQVRLETARQIALAIANAPEKTSVIELASGNGFSLQASRSKYKGGFAVTLVRTIDETTKERISVGGYRQNELSGVTLRHLIEYAENYVRQFIREPIKTGEIVIDPPTPITNADRAATVLNDIDKAIKHYRDANLHVTPLWAALNAARGAASVLKSKL